MKVLIVDDEQPARERLRQILDDEPDYEVIGEAANGHEALEVASHTHPDIVLLDIRMPGMEGIEAAHHLNEMDPPPAVVFTTAYDEYAVRAFDAEAVDYILKPVEPKRLQRALDRVAKRSREDAAARLEAVLERLRGERHPPRVAARACGGGARTWRRAGRG